MNLDIRTANIDDVAHIAQIQSACYAADFIEDQQAFAAKIMASPQTSWLVTLQQQAVGYLVSLPVRFDTMPTLNAPSFQVVADADALYLHDLAIHPEHRASGAGKQLIQHFKQYAARVGFQHLILIAVQDSATYWQRYGFQPVQQLPDFLAQKVSSFGDDAVLMHLSLT
jgi:ribosomal protein S18 acetylase RimI-like enzyme